MPDFRIYITFPFFFLIASLAFSQPNNSDFFCDFDRCHQHYLKTDQYEIDRRQKMEALWQEYMREGDANRKMLYTLPVVVHIIHDGGSENISDQSVLDGISHLNSAFANQGYYNPNTGVDTEIEFCLASQNPDGNATNGINRVRSSYTEFNYSVEEVQLKDLSRWDPTRYINIWVVREICSSFGCGVAGYAYFPSAHGNNVDGIVIESEYMSSNPSDVSVLVHEMGHYLGLYHTFQGGCTNNDCLSDGDRVCDTPPDNTTVRSNCNASINSCSSDADDASTNNPFRDNSLGGLGDQNDQFHNYMDYSQLTCYDQFTQGQKDRMIFSIERIRNSLLGSKACQDPCPQPVTASFIANNTDIVVGETVNFTNQSSGSTNYNWYIDDNLFSNAVNPNYTFNTEGVYQIVLEVFSSDPNCYSSFDTILIKVECPVEANFDYEQTGELEITVNDQSENADVIEYTVYDRFGSVIYQGSDRNFVVNFAEVGLYTICLEVSNSLCSDQLCKQVIVERFDDCAGGGKLLVFNEDNESKRGKLLTSSSGGFYFVYLHSADIVIRYLDSDLNILWSKSLSAIPNDISSRVLGLLYEDQEGNILINVRISRGGSSVLIKFNPFFQTIEWSRDMPSNGLFLYSAHEYFPGEYLMAGQVNECAETFLLRIRKNDGFSLDQRAYELGNCQSFYSSKIDGDNLYLCGRYSIGGWTNMFRAASTKINLKTFNIEWSKHYFVDEFSDARQYFRNLQIIDNEIFCVGYGTKVGIDASDFTGLFLKSDLNGNPLLAQEVKPIGAREAWLTEIVKKGNELFAFGRYHNISSNQLEIYVVRFSEIGEVLNIYTIDVGQGDQSIWFNEDQILIDGNEFVFGGNIGESTFVLKLDLDNLESNQCVDVEETTPLIHEFNNPFSQSHNLISRNASFSFPNVSISLDDPNTDISFNCFNSLPDLSIEVEPDTICIPFNTYGYITVNWCLVEGELNGEQVYGPLLNGDPFGTTLNTKETLGTPRALSRRDSCITEVIGLRAEDYDQGRWHYIVMNYNENHGSSEWRDGFPFDDIEECKYDNNLDSFFVRITPSPPDLGPDIEVCDNQIFNFEIPNIYETIRWSDGTTDSFYVAYSEGLHWVEVSDICGNVYRDSVWISYNPLTQVDLGPDIQVCRGEDLSLTTNIVFQNYQWFPNEPLDCADCPTVILQTDSSLTVSVLADNGDGCFSTDTVRIEVVEDVNINETIAACEGDTIHYRGLELVNSGFYTDTIQSLEACDTFFSLDLNFNQSYLFTLDAEICEGDSIFLGGQWIKMEGLYESQYQTIDGCDSLELFNVSITDRDTSFQEEEICLGDSVWFNDRWMKEAGHFSYIGQNQICDSVYFLTLERFDTSLVDLSYTLCEGDSIYVANEWITTPGSYSYFLTNQFGCDSLIRAHIEPVSLGTVPEVVIDCSSLEAIASISLDNGLSVEWSNGSMDAQTVYEQGDSAWAFVFLDLSCGKRYEFALPTLPDLTEAPEWIDSIVYRGEPFIIDLGLDSTVWSAQWNSESYFSCDTCLRTRLIYTEDAQIQLILTHSSGCQFEYLFNIFWRDQVDIYIPNSFSPNDDKNNDVWQIFARDHVDIFLEGAIYSRWGNEIRYWENTKEIVWDGTFMEEPLNPAVFVYYIKYRTRDGNIHLKKGDITLLR